MQESARPVYTDTENELRKKLFSFAKIHETILCECRHHLDSSVQEISRKFFDYINDRDEFSGITVKNPNPEKYAKPLAEYVKSLFCGNYNHDYMNSRIDFILGNISNGVPFKFYIAFLFVIKNIIVDVISRKAGGKPSVFAISGALDRLLMLELSVAHDIYTEETLNDLVRTEAVAENKFDKPIHSRNANPFALAYFKVAKKNSELQEAVKKESGKNPFAMAYYKVAAKHLPKATSRTIVRERQMNPMVLAYYKVVNRAREIQEMSRRDSLTGLYNRVILKSFLQRNISFSKRIAFPLSLAFFDVDEFKKINDTLGHQKGDEILMTIGGVLTATMRDVDRAFRFGGDEFCAVFPGTSAHSAIVFFERFKEGLQAIFPDVSLSIGIAQTGPDVFHEVDELIKRADELMYKAKQTKGFHVEYDSEGVRSEVPLQQAEAEIPEENSGKLT